MHEWRAAGDQQRTGRDEATHFWFNRFLVKERLGGAPGRGAQAERPGGAAGRRAWAPVAALGARALAPCATTVLFRMPLLRATFLYSYLS